MTQEASSSSKVPDFPGYITNLPNVFWPSRNQPFVSKALNCVLLNLEHQARCVAQLMIASVNPEDGTTSIKKYARLVTIYTTYPHV